MSLTDEPAPVRAPRERDRRPRVARKVLLALVGGALAFTAGVAVGQALEGGAGSGDVTYERTLTPVTVGPPARTVTVTTTAR